jgi:hypothetical protein
MPPAYVDAMLDLLAMMKKGQTAQVTPTVEQVLGRKPKTFAEWAQRNAAAFR